MRHHWLWQVTTYFGARKRTDRNETLGSITCEGGEKMVRPCRVRFCTVSQSAIFYFSCLLSVCVRAENDCLPPFFLSPSLHLSLSCLATCIPLSSFLPFFLSLSFFLSVCLWMPAASVLLQCATPAKHPV